MLLAIMTTGRSYRRALTIGVGRHISVYLAIFNNFSLIAKSVRLKETTFARLVTMIG